jgi:hypothetical protein
MRRVGLSDLFRGLAVGLAGQRFEGLSEPKTLPDRVLA